MDVVEHKDDGPDLRELLKQGAHSAMAPVALVLARDPVCVGVRSQ